MMNTISVHVVVFLCTVVVQNKCSYFVGCLSDSVAEIFKLSSSYSRVYFSINLIFKSSARGKAFVRMIYIN